jgi:hypothetical protein
MKCRKAKRLIKDGTYRENGSNQDARQAAQHTEQCERCHRDLLMESLSSALLSAHRPKLLPLPEIPENPYLMTRIKARIRELGEQGAGSWESAVLALRGWVIAIGAAAFLMLAISFQWQPSDRADRADRRDTANRANLNDRDDVSSLSNIGEDFLSGNFGTSNNPTTPTSEAPSNAHK